MYSDGKKSEFEEDLGKWVGFATSFIGLDECGRPPLETSMFVLCEL